MNYTDPKFDRIFGKSLSASMILLEEQNQRLKKLSTITAASSVTLAAKKLEQQNTAVFNKTLASLSSIISPVNQMISTQKSYNDRFKNVFSPVWTQKEAFTKFQNQTAQISKIINPNISDFIQNNVRIKYDKTKPITTLEATYLETFEQLETEVDSEILQEITEDIQNNPSWKEDLNKLGIAFHNSFLSNEFTIAITEIVNKRLEAKIPKLNPKIIAAILAILYLIYTLWDSIENE